MGSMCIESKYGKGYVLVVVDDFSRYSFVCFLWEKYKTIKHLKSLCTRIQVKIGHPIVRIRSDKGREFDNVEIDLLVNQRGLNMNIQSLPRTPE